MIVGRGALACLAIALILACGCSDDTEAAKKSICMSQLKEAWMDVQVAFHRGPKRATTLDEALLTVTRKQGRGFAVCCRGGRIVFNPDLELWLSEESVDEKEIAVVCTSSALGKGGEGVFRVCTMNGFVKDVAELPSWATDPATQ